MATKEGSSGTTTLLIIAGIGAAVYYYRSQIEAELATLEANAASGGGGGTASSAPVVGNMSPIIASTQASVPIGTQGCYFNLPSGNITCPPGVAFPTGSSPSTSCLPGYTVNPAGNCQAVRVASPITPSSSPLRTSPISITGGPVRVARANPILAAAMSKNANAAAPVPGQSASPAAPPPVRINSGGGRNGVSLRGISRLAAALPMTNQILIQASHDPSVAAAIADDPRAQLTVAQWNYFYAQASGQLQTRPTAPAGDNGMRVSAAQYQALRAQNGLPVRLGTLRPARQGAFPLGGIRSGQTSNTFTPWTFKGNRNIYRIPGQGLVTGPVRKMGLISSGGGDHRWSRSPFPRPSWWREAE